MGKKPAKIAGTKGGKKKPPMKPGPELQAHIDQCPKLCQVGLHCWEKRRILDQFIEIEETAYVPV